MKQSQRRRLLSISHGKNFYITSKAILNTPKNFRRTYKEYYVSGFLTILIHSRAKNGHFQRHFKKIRQKNQTGKQTDFFC